MAKYAERKAQLEARLRLLERRIKGIEGELERPHSQDWEDMATEREGDEVLEGVGMTGQAEIRRIEAALERIAGGTYGICAKCGAEVEPKRLDAVPEAPLCQSCARNAS
jgi:RNA polymerase-binding transcription factor DksA